MTVGTNIAHDYAHATCEEDCGRAIDEAVATAKQHRRDFLNILRKDVFSAWKAVEDGDPFVATFQRIVRLIDEEAAVSPTRDSGK